MNPLLRFKIRVMNRETACKTLGFLAIGRRLANVNINIAAKMIKYGGRVNNRFSTTNCDGFWVMLRVSLDTASCIVLQWYLGHGVEVRIFVLLPHIFVVQQGRLTLPSRRLLARGFENLGLGQFPRTRNYSNTHSGT